MAPTQTANGVALPGEVLSSRRHIEDWSEIEAVLAASTPLCERTGRVAPLIRRGRRAILACLIAGFCLAALPLDEAGNRCGGAGCAASASAEPVPAALPPERVARTDGVRDGTSLTEGRSSVADAGDADAAPMAVPQPAPLPRQAALPAAEDADSAAPPLDTELAPTRHFHHHAWSRRHHHAWR